jgi:hypothetical protein
MIRSAHLSSKVASRIGSRNNGAIRLMSKQIKFGVDGRAAMLKGVETLADAVQVRTSRKLSHVRKIQY